MKLFELLKEYAGMSQQEAEGRFRIEETAAEWVLKPIRYLETTTSVDLVRLAREYGGDYDKGARCFHIPKGKPEKPVSNSTSNSESSEEYALSRSLKGNLGQLVPCLADANGVVFDGLNRKQIDPNAWTVKLDKVKTAPDRIEARLQTNFCRRKYGSEEIREDIVSLVGYGFTAQQIADRNGVSLTTVYKYMPQELKDQAKVEAGLASGVSRTPSVESSVPLAEQTVKTQDMGGVKPDVIRYAQPNVTETPQFEKSAQEYIATEIIKCEKCDQPVHRSKASIVGGKLVCPKCSGKTEPVKKPGFTKLSTKPQETWEHRKAQMSPQHSNMENAILIRLSDRGVKVMTDFEFCLQRTMPDFWFPDKQLAVYLDGVVHQGKEDRDEALRDLLRKRHGVNVVSIPYVADSELERERIFGIIMEETKP